MPPTTVTIWPLTSFAASATSRACLSYAVHMEAMPTRSGFSSAMRAFDLGQGEAEAFVTVEKRKRCDCLPPVKWGEFGEAVSGQGRRPRPCPRVEDDDIGNRADPGGNIEKTQRIGADRRVVEVFDRGLDEEHFHGCRLA